MRQIDLAAIDRFRCNRGLSVAKGRGKRDEAGATASASPISGTPGDCSVH
jgi:hypothetical protein